MPRASIHCGRLSEGLASGQWDAVLTRGRLERLGSCCWLETYSRPADSLAIFLSGRVSLRPLLPEQALDRGMALQLSPAPVVLELSAEPLPSRCHWVSDPAAVCFFSRRALLAAITAAPAFGCNVVGLLSAQQASVAAALGDPTAAGVERLARALLARMPSDAAESREGAPRTTIEVTQAELAFESGLSRQWVNRLLRGLEAKGIAQVGRGHVVLPSPVLLRELL